MVNLLINNVLKEYNEMKKGTKTYLACAACVACLAEISDHKVFDHTRKFIKDFSLLIKQCYHIIL